MPANVDQQEQMSILRPTKCVVVGQMLVVDHSGVVQVLDVLFKQHLLLFKPFLKPLLTTVVSDVILPECRQWMSQHRKKHRA